MYLYGTDVSLDSFDCALSRCSYCWCVLKLAERWRTDLIDLFEHIRTIDDFEHLNVHLVRTVFALIFMWFSEFYNVYPRLFVKLVLFNSTLIEINEMFKQALNFIVALNVYQFSFIYFSFSFQFKYNSISQNDLVEFF